MIINKYNPFFPETDHIVQKRTDHFRGLLISKGGRGALLLYVHTKGPPNLAAA